MSRSWAIKKFDNSRLAAKLKLLSGQSFDQNQQNLDLQKLRDEYGGDGYVFAKIEADNRFLEEPGKLDIVYNVEEGSRYRVGRINIEIKGENPHTQITTVLNRLSFKPGDIVDTREFAGQRAAAEGRAALQGRAAEGHRAEDRLLAARVGRQGHGDRRPAANELLPRAGRRSPLAAGRRLSRCQRQCRTPGAGSRRAAAECPVRAGRLSAAHVPRPDLPAVGLCDRVSLGQAYPPPPLPAASPADLRSLSPRLRNRRSIDPAAITPANQPRSPAVIQTRYEPSDGWTQPQPQQQGQSWPPAGNGNNGSYAAQPPQNYPAPQPPPAGSDDVLQSAARRSLRRCACRAALGLSFRRRLMAAAPNYGAPAGAGPAYALPILPRDSRRVCRGRSQRRSGPLHARAVRRQAGPWPRSPPAGDLFSNPEPTMVPPPTGDPLRDLPVRITPEETQTGRLMFGVGVNSDAGLVGNITLDEQNFDWTKVPDQLGRHHGRPRLPRRGRAVPLGTGARHPGPALHDQLPGAVPELENSR